MIDLNASIHLSTNLADLVTGEFNLEGMDHVTRVQRIFTLITMYDAVMKIGDLEHTSDWDWRITVITASGHDWGTWSPDHDSTGFREDAMCDTMRLAYEVEPGDYLDGFQRWNYLTLEVFHDDDTEPTEQLVPIDDIATITIGEA